MYVGCTFSSLIIDKKMAGDSMKRINKLINRYNRIYMEKG